MKIKFWILATTLALTAMARAATNDLTGLLQKGLFDEEANRDLNAAIADYQSVASAFDKDRQLAATAIFRLGECYRKLGKPNEATVQYQRIIKEFSDQPTLVMLSRQNLAGMGASIPTANVTGGAATAVTDEVQQVRQQIEQVKAQMVKDRNLLETLQKMPVEKLQRTLTQLVPDAQLDELQMRLDQARQDLIKLKTDYTPDHPKYKAAAEVAEDLEKRVAERVNTILGGLEAKQESQNNYVDEMRARLARETEAREQLPQRLADLTAQIQSDERQREELLKTFPPENSQVKDLTKKIEADRNSLAQARSSAAQLAVPVVAPEGVNPVTDEEQTQIRNIQAMIQNSPDLINAPDGNGVTPLILAAEKGQLVVAKYLLDHGADVNGLSRNHGTVPLIAAAQNGRKAMVELLLSRGADVSGGGLNPLYEAVKRGYVSVAEVLLANKADINLRSGTDNIGMRPVHIAARDGRTEMLQLLIKHGADVNVTDNQKGYTPLELAAMQGEVPTVKILLAAKANVEARDKGGETPLEAAIHWEGGDKADMASLLLDGGANVDATNRDGATPLLFAVASGAVNSVRVLLAHKADPNRGGGMVIENKFATYAPVFLAIPHPEILKLLLDAGGNPEGMLPSAIDQGQVDSVRLLLEHGADPNRPGPNGAFPLAQAIRNSKSKSAIPLLLDKGADPNAKDSDGSSPLFRTTDPEIGRWLIDHKADVNARIQDGRTPLMTQVFSTNYIEFLIEAGAGIDLKDTNDNTALHHAVFFARVDTVDILLKHKANPNIQNDAGFTPLDLAKDGLSGRIGPGMMAPSYGLQTVTANNEKNIAELLTSAGGLADLPKRNRIEVRRGSSSAGGETFTKSSHDWNRYSLLEMIAGEYRLLSQSTGGDWGKVGGMRSALWDNYLRFPDFKNIVIYRRTDASAKQKPMNVNVEEILSSGDCSRDMWLEWGDIVEIPESDHPVDQHWNGLTHQTVTALTNCLARQVTVIVKGVSTPLKLVPSLVVEYTAGTDEQVRLTYVSFMLRSVLDNSKLIRVSSDLSRVKVTRIDPQTKKKDERTIDCTNPSEADLWLRDGDVIDVPEK